MVDLNKKCKVLMVTFSRYLMVSYLLFSTCLNKATAQNPGNVPMTTSRFITGDNAAYKSFVYDDSRWEIQKTGIVWQEQGHDN